QINRVHRSPTSGLDHEEGSPVDPERGRELHASRLCVALVGDDNAIDPPPNAITIEALLDVETLGARLSRGEDLLDERDRHPTIRTGRAFCACSPTSFSADCSHHQRPFRSWSGSPTGR